MSDPLSNPVWAMTLTPKQTVMTFISSAAQTGAPGRHFTAALCGRTAVNSTGPESESAWTVASLTISSSTILVFNGYYDILTQSPAVTWSTKVHSWCSLKEDRDITDRYIYWSLFRVNVLKFLTVWKQQQKDVELQQFVSSTDQSHCIIFFFHKQVRRMWEMKESAIARHRHRDEDKPPTLSRLHQFQSCSPHTGRFMTQMHRRSSPCPPLWRLHRL